MHIEHLNKVESEALQLISSFLSADCSVFSLLHFAAVLPMLSSTAVIAAIAYKNYYVYVSPFSCMAVLNMT